MIKISASILSADFANLGRGITAVQAAGADYLHIDVMDGEFVPNITIGMPVIQAIRRFTDMPLDVHLMIDKPHRYITEFCGAGADIITIHLEAGEPQSIIASLQKIRSLGKKSGLAIKPLTPAEHIFPYLYLLDCVMIMTVEPGFGGQSFMPDQLPKIKLIADEIKNRRLDTIISVDGGIDDKTAPLVIASGSEILAAGSYIFRSADMKAAIESLKNI